MNILMMTNTYTPIVGGLERSVKAFKEEYQRRGHRALVVAPRFEGMPERERDVLRVPAIPRFNGSDFSVKLPVPRILTQALVEFHPDIIHCHHPFLIGNTGLRLAHTRSIPLIFTHHTLFEQYTHYVPGDSPAMQRFVVELATGYANLCDQVFAPSDSVAQLLKERGVETPIAVVPTGIDESWFTKAMPSRVRRQFNIPDNAFLVGHVGRLAPEKNLAFLFQAIARFLQQQPRAHCLVVGQGPSEAEIRQLCEQAGVADRVHLAGVLQGRALIDAYGAMDVFAFASKSETQGLVVAEAMATRVPVVALDAPGVREVVEDGRNGRLLSSENAEEFASALAWVASRPAGQRRAMSQAARRTAEQFSMPRCADRALTLYAGCLLRSAFERRPIPQSAWSLAMSRMKSEWSVLKTVAKATSAAMTFPPKELEAPGSGVLALNQDTTASTSPGCDKVPSPEPRAGEGLGTDSQSEPISTQ